MKNTTFLILILFSLVIPLWSQVEVEDLEDNIQSDENATEVNQLEIDPGRYAYLREYKINLNEITQDQLDQLEFLEEIQKTAILQYCNTHSPLLSIYELQSIPQLNPTVVRKILPFIEVKEDIRKQRVSIDDILRFSKNQLTLRWTRTLELTQGYITHDSLASTYLGTPDRLYLRYKHEVPGKMIVGLIMEKDPGESMFRSDAIKTIDYISGHIQLKHIHPKIPQLIIGDYYLSVGQGMILSNRYGSNKGIFTTDIKRNPYHLSPYTSVDENNAFRGLASRIQWTKHLQSIVFYSNKRYDGNLLNTDSDQEEEDRLTFSSIQTSGLHRNRGELADRKTIPVELWGTSMLWTLRNFQANITAYHQDVKARFVPDQLYESILHPTGSKDFVSLNAQYRYKNFTSFTEQALDIREGAYASIQGVQIGFGKFVDWAFSMRYITPQYFSYRSRAFTENTNVTNEFGLYQGVQIKLHKQLLLSAYSDLWRHPWIKFQSAFSTEGDDWLIRLAYHKRRSWNTYIQYKHKQSQENMSGTAEIEKQIQSIQQHAIRWHLELTVGKGITSRTRLEYKRYCVEGADDIEGGILFFQDFLYRPIGTRWSGNCRLAYFNTDTYNSRIYAYENEILYQVNIPAYFGAGTKTYVNFRYAWSKSLMTECKIAYQFNLKDAEIGSSTDKINDAHRTELKLQARWIF